jgi:alpha-mannosidase
MQKHRDLTLRRLAKFGSDAGLRGMLYPMQAPVQLSVYHAPGRITYTEAMQGEYVPLQVGERFGPNWSTHWVRAEFSIPSGWAGREVHFLWDANCEGCIWQDGKPLQGLTGSGNGWDARSVRKELILTRAAKGGEACVLYVEVAVNCLFGMPDPPWPNLGLLELAAIGVFDRDAWDLLWDFTVVANMAEYLPANTPRGAQALFAANQMVNLFRAEDRSTWAEARSVAARYFSAHNGGGQFNLAAIGHAHIDTAWLWPLAETRRKCVRTFSSAVRYMDDYPDYKFACSQAQQYEWIKNDYPDLYERIRQKVKEGRFIPAGGSWVEPDANMPSGEALVRQFVFGQRFFQKEFGITCTEFWEPDVFGYSAALPQILRGVGMDHFLTIKLSWSQFNKIQSHTFWWEGLDGSRVLTHFPPADTYNSEANVKEVLFSMSNYKDLERSNEAYLLFGYGDGGGGPTVAMLEQLQRMRDVDGLPRVEMLTPTEFFQRLETDSQDLTTWVGELYLELHRGTYTTQARNKRYNRQSELLLRDVEFLSAVTHDRHGAAYPAEVINELWKRVLTNQFHDIIPGSSIAEVYQDSTPDYEDLISCAKELRAQAVDALAGGQQASADRCVLAVNTLDHPRTEVVELPDGVQGGQTVANGKALGIISAPSMGYAVAGPRPASGQASVSHTDGRFVFENPALRAVFLEDGSLVSLVEKASGRESVAAGTAANHFVLFDDTPANWDAWDVDVFHLEKRDEVGAALSVRVIEAGPLRAAVEFTYVLSPLSSLRQVVTLTAVSRRLEFATEVDWHEAHRFLKVEFPLNLRAQNATYEIQFGHVERPTHMNTSWDMARFEVCAHKWADLSEPDFGVTLFNDCKYGHGAQDNVLRLSLLRSPKSPDPTADMGQHTFRYGLMPHTGSFQASGVVHEGYDFNVPLLVNATNVAPAEVSFFQIDNPAVIIDTVKKAEDSDEIVVRLYEAHGSRGAVRLSSCLPVISAVRCNLLEEPLPEGQEVPVAWEHGELRFHVRPFQIVTLKLKTER